MTKLFRHTELESGPIGGRMMKRAKFADYIHEITSFTGSRYTDQVDYAVLEYVGFKKWLGRMGQAWEGLPFVCCLNVELVYEGQRTSTECDSTLHPRRRPLVQSNSLAKAQLEVRTPSGTAPFGRASKSARPDIASCRPD